MKKTILISAIAVSLFMNSASAGTVVDELSQAFGTTAKVVGHVIDKVSEILGFSTQSPTIYKRTLPSPSKMFQNAESDRVPAEENHSLLFASLYPELSRLPAKPTAHHLARERSAVLNELKKQELERDLIASQYTALVAQISQNDSDIPFLIGEGQRQSSVSNWDKLIFDQNPNSEMNALLAKMASNHAQNPNFSLLIKAGK